ncbi:MAG: proton-conducting transporter membrane subunit, partial [Anaerolineae bacterium]
MNHQFLLLPLILLLAGTAVAGLCRLPALRRRLNITALSLLLALLPLAAFVLLVMAVGLEDRAGQPLTWRLEWIPSLGLGLSLYYDHLSGLFALLVTGIGALVVVYAGYYFRPDHIPESPSHPGGEGRRERDGLAAISGPSPTLALRHKGRGDQTRPGDGERPGSEHWRFLAYLLLFMTSMLGLVMAGDVITLFIFWEGTSIASFLLVAYKTKDQEARQGAFRALFITGGGGIALLAGLLMTAYVAGGTDFATILTSGDALRGDALYPVLLGLLAFGAFTKSAQVPAHIWLPGAMSAPTPASAFLHSATMVKAGIYLMARMNPALGFTDLWF